MDIENPISWQTSYEAKLFGWRKGLLMNKSSEKRLLVSNPALLWFKT